MVLEPCDVQICPPVEILDTTHAARIEQLRQQRHDVDIVHREYLQLQFHRIIGHMTVIAHREIPHADVEQSSEGGQ
ncbi:hypothetical protein [Rhodococcus sp. 27YEA15]|uniref:hypothetical protein n=1 Tax=Rhodococcus sp. 27YEA15 TaxID=3156259 RepID=UPI003C7C1055